MTKKEEIEKILKKMGYSVYIDESIIDNSLTLHIEKQQKERFDEKVLNTIIYGDNSDYVITKSINKDSYNRDVYAINYI